MGACASKSKVSEAEPLGAHALPGHPKLAAPPAAAPPAGCPPSDASPAQRPVLFAKQPLTPGTPQQDTIPAKLAFERAEEETPVRARAPQPGACTPPSPLSQARPPPRLQARAVAPAPPGARSAARARRSVRARQLLGVRAGDVAFVCCWSTRLQARPHGMLRHARRGSRAFAAGARSACAPRGPARVALTAVRPRRRPAGCCCPGWSCRMRRRSCRRPACRRPSARRAAPRSRPGARSAGAHRHMESRARAGCYLASPQLPCFL